MANKFSSHEPDTVGAWAKRCYLAGRAAMEDVLRPFDIGTTQWYVLYHLAEGGPTMQRDLLRLLAVERATLSVVVSGLVRKGLVEQIPDRTDQRQKLIRLTPAGVKLWNELPDLTFIRQVGFEGIDRAALETTITVLRTATERLEQLLSNGAGE
jgi:DNA-binding MarR family transcriptional regulator